ncbi:rod shape-determining protein MreD [Fibrobacteres bacterium R8-0-B4]
MMHIILKWTGWIILCLILQSTLVPYLAVMSFKPDLPLIALFYLSLSLGVMPGVYVGFFLGLGQDLFSQSFLGQTALAKCVAGFVIGLFNERVVRLDPITRGALLIAMFILNDTIVMLVHIVKSDGGAGPFFTELLMVTLPRALYSLVFAAIPLVWVNVVKPHRLVD